jgi:hypothetical protein
MKIKTSELTGNALAAVVGRIEGIAPRFYDADQMWTAYLPHELWEQGGLIIEREKLTMVYNERGDGPRGWRTIAFIKSCMEYGPTPLIAAMRCYVASKLGDEVDVPEELI